MAPGYKIKTLAPNNQITYESGTSMSAAIISGLAALVLNIRGYTEVGLLKEALLSSTYDFPFTNEVIRTNQFIKGIPDAQKVLNILLPVQIPMRAGDVYINSLDL